MTRFPLNRKTNYENHRIKRSKKQKSCLTYLRKMGEKFEMFVSMNRGKIKNCYNFLCIGLDPLGGARDSLTYGWIGTSNPLIEATLAFQADSLKSYLTQLDFLSLIKGNQICHQPNLGQFRSRVRRKSPPFYNVTGWNIYDRCKRKFNNVQTNFLK